MMYHTLSMLSFKFEHICISMDDWKDIISYDPIHLYFLDLVTHASAIRHGLIAKLHNTHIWTDQNLTREHIKVASSDLNWSPPITIKMARQKSIEQINNLASFV